MKYYKAHMLACLLKTTQVSYMYVYTVPSIVQQPWSVREVSQISQLFVFWPQHELTGAQCGHYQVPCVP